MLKLNDKKVSVISHSIMGAIIITLLAIASFYDLQISQAMSNPTSVFAIVFASLGEFPSYMIMPLVGTIAFYADFSVKKSYSILIKSIFAVVVFAGFMVWGLFREEGVKSIGILIIYSVLLSAGCLFVGNMMDRDLATRLIKWCIFAVCTVALTVLLTNIIKLTWGRVRYRDLVASGSMAAFTPWYIPQGWDTINNSFSSGHTASACNIFVFVVLFDYSKKYRKYRCVAYMLATLFTVMTALSRIVANAHYLSDVIVGGALSYAVFYMFKAIFFKNKEFVFLLNRKVDAIEGADE